MLNILHFQWQRPGDTCHFQNNVTNSINKLQFKLIGLDICSSGFHVTWFNITGLTAKSFIYQQKHFISVLENIKIYITTYIKIASTCFGLRPSSGSLHMSLAACCHTTA